MKKVLIFTRRYLPGYKAGGPIRSVSNLITHLGDYFKFNVVTSDRDSFEEKPYSEVLINEWMTVGKANVFYTSTQKRNIKSYINIIDETKCDIIYLNSFYDVKFSLLPLLAAKFFIRRKVEIVLAPRGEFSEGALNLKSIKKRAYIGISRFLKLHRNIRWHASSQYEKADIRSVMNIDEKLIVVAPNISFNDQEKNYVSPDYDGTLKVVFVSRISRIKNLDFALKVLSCIDKKIEFNIYGLVCDEEYWEECKSLINNMPPNIKVSYHGTISHDEVKLKIAENHLFFLPTKGENFGHVIAEAFSTGTPVLISTATLWRNLEESNVGWDLDLDQPEFFKDKIRIYYNMLESNQQMSKEHILDWIGKKLEDKSVLDSNLQLFQ